MNTRRFLFFICCLAVAACDDGTTNTTQDTGTTTDAGDDGTTTTDATTTTEDGTEGDATTTTDATSTTTDATEDVANSDVIETSCDNGVLDGQETDVDCGGACSPCGTGASCTVSVDCQSRVCESDTCQAPTCSDNVTNGTETDVDCGPGCDTCDDGQLCTVDLHCTSGVCGDRQTCEAPTCSDGVANGTETDTDCGGGACDKCAADAVCDGATDCTSGVCTDSVCVAAACDDGLLNGAETYIDCGGPTCDGCGTGESCSANRDCASGICNTTNRACVQAGCGDGVRNGEETYIDCGGSECEACPAPRPCELPRDCLSGVCTSNACRDASCNDNVQNSDETDTDCGGSCSVGCALGQACLTGDDCDSGFCDVDTCVEPPSCAAIIAAGLSTGDGDYTIDPDGTGPVEPLEVTCDMTTDGGVGYTMLRIDDSTNLVVGSSTSDAQDAYRAACDAVGMEMIVPRTRAHAASIAAYNGDEPPNIVNVYPKSDGATGGLSDWQGICQGQPCNFYLSNSNSAYCPSLEPNGDNNTADAIYRRATDPTTCTVDYGAWNDAHGAMAVPGYVICSTNDAGPRPGTDCADILARDAVWNAGPEGISGIYTIDPDGLDTGNAPFDVYCEQSRDGGGWTLLLSADGSSTYWGNNSPQWKDGAPLGSAPTSLTNVDYKSQAYGDLSTSIIKLCRNDADTCYNLPHSLDIPLLTFFTDDISYDHYAFDIINHDDTGSAANRDAYISGIGLTGYWTLNTCFWLGINEVSMASGIGLMGDANSGCKSNAQSNSYIDDLAIGLGLQSCRDANGCPNGGTGHLAGQSRGANGVDESGVFGPWFVFGK